MGDYNQTKKDEGIKTYSYLDNEICFIADMINQFCYTLSKLTTMDLSYFFRIVEQIDFIPYMETDLTNNYNVNNQCNYPLVVFDHDEVSISYSINDISHQEYHFMQCLTNLFIQCDLQNHRLQRRNLSVSKSSEGLYLGMVEYITQRVFSRINCSDHIKDYKEEHLFEQQIIDYLASVMGRELFLFYSIKNPTYLFDQIASISYQSGDLLIFLDDQIQKLNDYDYQQGSVLDLSVLDIIELISDNAKRLKLERRMNR